MREKTGTGHSFSRTKHIQVVFIGLKEVENDLHRLEIRLDSCKTKQMLKTTKSGNMQNSKKRSIKKVNL